MGKLRDQQAVLSKAVALNPLDPVIAVNAAEAASNIGNDAEAMRILERLLAVTPNSDMLLRTMGGIQYDQKHIDTALGYAYKAYQTEPDNPNNVTFLTGLLTQLNREDDTKKILNRFKNETLDSINAQITQLKHGDISLTPQWQKIVAESIKSKRVDPIHIGMLEVIAQILISNKKYDQTVELLQLPLAEDENLSNREAAINLISLYVYALKQSGKQADAKLWQERLNTMAKEWLEQGWGGTRRELLQANVAVTNGDRELAIRSLVSAYEKGFFEVWTVSYDPRFSDVLSDPRIQNLQKRYDADIQRMRDATESIKIEIPASNANMAGM
jgi:tetratricopeptide (TPR) repeat protein